MALVPEVMRDVKEGEMARVWSISSSRGLTVEGKADSQGSSIPTRWTPWPGKKRAVFGRVGWDVYGLVDVVDVCVDVCFLALPPLETWKTRPPSGTFMMFVMVVLRLEPATRLGASLFGVGVVECDDSCRCIA